MMYMLDVVVNRTYANAVFPTESMTSNSIGYPVRTVPEYVPEIVAVTPSVVASAVKVKSRDDRALGLDGGTCQAYGGSPGP